MANERLSMRKIRDVLRLDADGLSQRMIALSLQIGRTTVRDYLMRTQLAGLSWPLPCDITDEDLEAQLFAASDADKTAKYAVPDWKVIHKERSKPHVTLSLLWEEYRSEHPKGYSYSQFCLLYRQWRGKLSVSMRQSHVAGEKMFVDYAGSSVPIIDPVSFEIRETQLFVAALGASNYTFAEATWSQGLFDWIGSHVRAFEYFGGVPAQIVPDNLKSAVIKSCLHEPAMNRTYADLARHYDSAIIPARPYKPKDKAKAEVAVQVAQRWIVAKLRHRTFTSLQELNSAIRDLLKTLNNRVTRHLGASRQELFEQTDRPALKPLPSLPYVYAKWEQQRVGLDYHLKIDDHFYSVPHKYIRQKLWIRTTESSVEVFERNKRIACHVRSGIKGSKTTCKKHMPNSHRRYADWTSEKVKEKAAQIGSSTQILVDIIMRERPHPEMGLRSCIGILKLAKIFGKDRLEAACERALGIGARSYSSVQSILRNNLDGIKIKQPPEGTTDETVITHHNIRGSNYFH